MTKQRPSKTSSSSNGSNESGSSLSTLTPEATTLQNSSSPPTPPKDIFVRRSNGSVGGKGNKKRTSNSLIMLLFGSVCSFVIFTSYYSSYLMGNGGGVEGTTDVNKKTEIAVVEDQKLRQLRVSQPQFEVQQLQLQQQQHQHAEQKQPRKRRRLGVLLGIFTADYPQDRTYRFRQRRLFKIWNDPRVCALHTLKDMTEEQQLQCELVYTFILGANPDGPTEIVNNSTKLLAPQPVQAKAKDLTNDDITPLNIKENMNEGKSQTFFYFASQVMEEYDLDYAIKCDGDSAIHLHEFFVFAYLNLLSYPDQNPLQNVYAGSLRDKAYWPKHPQGSKEEAQYESFFGSNYEGVHLYIAGQFYVVSRNLVRDVLIKEVPNAHEKGYLEGHEDHDIAAIIYHSHNPVHLITMGRQHRCWEHPVKGEKRWQRILEREQARMDGKVFEGKLFPTDSSYEDVIIHKNSSLLPAYAPK